MIGEVQSLSQGIEGEIWMQIDKPTFIHSLILKQEELKTSFILIFSFVLFFFFHVELARMFMA